MEGPTATKIKFGTYELDPARRSLTREGEALVISAKAFDLLNFLVQNHGKLVSKVELLENVWPEQFVEENNLAVQVSALRKAFGDKGGSGKFIATVPGKGYSFVAEVDEVLDEMVVEKHSISRVVIDEEIGPAVNPESASISPQSLMIGVGERTHTRYWYYAASLIGVIVLLGFAAWNGGGRSDERAFSLTKLTGTGRVTIATITSDGKYMVFAQTDPDGESLWLRQISTGSQQQIMAPKPVRYVGLAITPDSGHIFATTFADNIADPQLWRFPLLGGAVELLPDVTTGASVSFSPDGKQMAFTESRSSQKQTQLLIADANGKDKRVIVRAINGQLSFPTFSASPVSWSPDGKFIACAVSEKTDGVRSGILLVDPQNGSNRFISDRRWEQIDNVAWIDDDRLAFIALTVDPLRGQVLSVSRNSGEVSTVTNDLHDYGWIASSAGSVVAVQQNPISRISIGDLTETSDRAEMHEIYRESGYIDNVIFIADGRVLYSSNESGKREIWRMNSDGSEKTQLTVDAIVTFGITVSPIDGSIVYCAAKDGKYSLWIADAGGNNPRPLTDGPEDIFPYFTPDGQSVVYQNGFVNNAVALKRVLLSDGVKSELSNNYASHPAVSADGTTIAYYFMDAATDNQWRIGLMSRFDGSYLGKLSFPKPITNRRMRWHPSGNYIGQIFNEGDNFGLLMMSATGGDHRSIPKLGKGSVNWFEWSRDGRQIVVSHTEQSQDVVILSK